MSGTAILGVAGFSSYQYLQLSKTISEKDQALVAQAAHLAALEAQYQQKNAELNLQVAKLNEKSKLLGNVLESLPDSDEISALSAISQDESTLNEQPSDIVEPVEAILENANESVTPPTEPAVAPAKEQNTLSYLLEQQNQQLDAHFDKAYLVIAKRKQTLEDAITKAGLDKNYLTDVASQQAQGGPFNEVNTDLLSNQHNNLLDELVLLNYMLNEVSYLPTSLPAKDFYISSRYGFRKDPITKRKAMHKGIDLAGWHKTKIYAPSNGVVSKAGRNGGYGNFIEIKHENGFVTRYGHLAKIQVKVGQTVNKEDVIGLMGSTGRSTSTHLHYEVLHNGKHINPLKLTKAFENVL